MCQVSATFKFAPNFADTGLLRLLVSLVKTLELPYVHSSALAQPTRRHMHWLPGGLYSSAFYQTDENISTGTRPILLQYAQHGDSPGDQRIRFPTGQRGGRDRGGRGRVRPGGPVRPHPTLPWDRWTYQEIMLENIEKLQQRLLHLPWRILLRISCLCSSLKGSPRTMRR